MSQSPDLLPLALHAREVKRSDEARKWALNYLGCIKGVDSEREEASWRWGGSTIGVQGGGRGGGVGG